VYKLSLKIDGDISIEAFRQALSSFADVLHQLDESVSGGRSVRWMLTELRRTSPAVMTWAGEPRPDKKSTTDFAPVVGESLISGMETLERGQGRPPSFTDDALNASKRLAQLRMYPGITGLTVVGENSARGKEPRALDLTERVAASVGDIIGPKHTAVASVEGKLEAINAHGTLHFVIFDSIWGGRVRCDMPDSLKPKALNAFEKRVLVTGTVRTDAAGHPRHIKVETLDSLPGRDKLPQSLRGIDPGYTEGLTPSEYLKRRWSGDA
jgi:hypothetical protein